MLMKAHQWKHGAKACNNSNCEHLDAGTMSCMAYTTARATHKHIGRTAKHWYCIDIVGRFDSLWELNGSCWIWIGKVTSNSSVPYISGYWLEPFANRVAYKLHKSTIPEGASLRRVCKQKLCVNPDHHKLVDAI